MSRDSSTLEHQRCESCGSWDAECSSPTPVVGCGCCRCAAETIRLLRRELDELAAAALARPPLRRGLARTRGRRSDVPRTTKPATLPNPQED